METVSQSQLLFGWFVFADLHASLLTWSFLTEESFIGLRTEAEHSYGISHTHSSILTGTVITTLYFHITYCAWNINKTLKHVICTEYYVNVPVNETKNIVATGRLNSSIVVGVACVIWK